MWYTFSNIWDTEAGVNQSISNYQVIALGCTKVQLHNFSDNQPAVKVETVSIKMAHLSQINLFPEQDLIKLA